MKVKIIAFNGWQVHTNLPNLGWFVIGVYETEEAAKRACVLNKCKVVK